MSEQIYKKKLPGSQGPVFLDRSWTQLGQVLDSWAAMDRFGHMQILIFVKVGTFRV